MMDPVLGRPVRHLVAKDLQAEAAPPARDGRSAAILAGFLPVVALGMCIPHVAYFVLGGH